MPVMAWWRFRPAWTTLLLALPLALARPAGAAPADSAPSDRPAPPVVNRDPPPTPASAPAAGGSPQPGDPADGGFPPIPGNIPWPTVEATVSGETGDAAEVRYTVEETGLGPLGLDDEFRSLSSLIAKKGDPANLAQINRRISEDRDTIDQLLRSVGYYGGDTQVSVTSGATPSAPTRIAIAVTPGPLYHFDAVTVTGTGGSDPEPARKQLALAAGDVVDATKVNAALAALPRKLAENGYPFAQVGPPDITVDHATRTAQLALSVATGPRGVFGTVRFASANNLFDDRHLNKLVRMQPGEPYDSADLEDLRRALIQTGLFGSVSIKPVAAGVEREDGTQIVDLVVTADAAPLRTVAATGGYSTRQGIRLEGSWQHRNFFKPEGALTVRAVAAENEQLIGSEVRFHNWRKRDQTLLLQAQASAEQYDAYNSAGVRFGAALERETNIIWQKKWVYSIGVQFEVSSQRDQSAPGNPRNTYYIAALPGVLTYDGSDDLLNPSKGFRLTGRASPEFSLRSGNEFVYLKLQGEGSYYQPFGPVVLAGRVHLGSIVGASRGTIAPDRRFYAGGGGSVRGYDYQGVGPRDAQNTPLGGNSLTELNFEVRYRTKAFGSDIGIVPFIDAGRVDTSSIPRFDNMQFGAGIGLRYYTAFGPVRVDVATPLNPREGDPKIAFYVSIGQAF
jgi:translocation and assembly module TamA